jgi:16S rRNA (cytosine1402-N4)-methyltransferase
MNYEHVPVMLKEVIELLNVKPGGRYIDGTLGGAGYTLEIAKRVGKEGMVLALDMDTAAIDNASQKMIANKLSNIKLVQQNFKNIKEAAHKYMGKNPIDGVVLDLGLSSYQLADKSRGFSFNQDAPLNMAMGTQAQKSTLEIVNNYSQRDLEKVFKIYGEEQRAYKIASLIVKERDNQAIKRTSKLAEIAIQAYPKRHYYKIHPATKIFQALRMETNGELENLETVLPASRDILKKRGRLVVVSFHSGEDRVVKNFLKNDDEMLAIHKKPLTPSKEEIEINPRSRSAKLRAGIKMKKELLAQ